MGAPASPTDQSGVKPNLAPPTFGASTHPSISTFEGALYESAVFHGRSTDSDDDDSVDVAEQQQQQQPPPENNVTSGEESEEEDAPSTSSEPLNFGEVPEQQERPLYTGAPISIEDSVLSIFSFVQSENLSAAGVAKLLKLIEIHCPKPNKCVPTVYKLFKQFEHVKTQLQSYF
ncbi:uncharacterized protein LOC127751196 isoform X2 [Frankliniella occidentalis]|uniref:Uncharacterized protein LOC127751196 isoform X2 n=1 Tax=Frankliniella occidentalis TaxID=133901 RepID=A0A9C6X6U7_FRAOC|nr:uncharacterized protein LOC127751196 isoform X2 [Frankliniella occidentalis]